MLVAMNLYCSSVKFLQITFLLPFLLLVFSVVRRGFYLRKQALHYVFILLSLQTVGNQLFDNLISLVSPLFPILKVITSLRWIKFMNP
jgi:hypothetical protein